MRVDERLLSVFKGERPDVVPWFADLVYWYNASVRRGTLPQRYRADHVLDLYGNRFPAPNVPAHDNYEGDGVVQLYREMGCGCHEHALTMPWSAEYEDVAISAVYQTDGIGDPALEEIEIRTPVGTLSQVRTYGPGSYCWAITKRAVASVEDLRTLRFVYEHMHVSADYRQQRRQMELWDGVGVVSSCPPKTPMASLITHWMGIVNASYALADARDEMERTERTMERAMDPIFEIVEAAPAPLVYLADNITGHVVSPSIFNTYYAPYYRRRLPGLWAAGKQLFVHVDGTFRALLRHIAATGVDCAQSLTPWPLGDVAVSEMRELAGPDLILWSGVPGALFSPLYEEDMVRDVVMDCITYHKAHGRFIIGVCDEVPPDGLLERVRLVTQLVDEFGRY